MLTPAERRQRIALIRELPAKLEAAIDGLDARQLEAPGIGGEWSIRQVVHHMADADLNFVARMKMILTADEPRFALFEQDEWARLPDAVEAAIEPSMSILEGLHTRWTLLLEGVPESSWKRQGVHPETGPVSLDDLLVKYTDHGETHLEQITKIRAAIRR
jgi:uncharacterized damage-inducible protein DinB